MAEEQKKVSVKEVLYDLNIAVKGAVNQYEQVIVTLMSANENLSKQLEEAKAEPEVSVPVAE